MNAVEARAVIDAAWELERGDGDAALTILRSVLPVAKVVNHRRERGCAGSVITTEGRCATCGRDLPL